MSEQTNQTNSGKDLVFDAKDFTDDVQDTSKETEDNTSTESVVKEKIKYNGQEMELTLDELKTHAQKGLNYDKIVSERDSLKNSEELTYLRELAKEQGVDTKTLVQKMKESKQKQQIESRAKELEESEGLNPTQALKMAELELKVNQPKQENPTDAIQREFETLLREFPETREQFKEFKDLPKSVSDAIVEGKSVTLAYAKHLVEESNKAKEVALQELEASKRTPGSLNGVEKQTKNDPFLDGLWGKK